MNIIWTNFRRLDRDVDIATYTEMTRELERRGHIVTLIFPSTDKCKGLYISDNTVLLPTCPWRIVFSIVFAVRLLLYVIFKITHGYQGIIIMDFFSFYALAPCMFLSRIICRNIKFVLDIRTIPVEVHDVVDRIKEKMFFLAIKIAGMYTDGITVITQSMRIMLFGRKYAIRKSIGVWTSGVSLKHFYPREIHTRSSKKEPFVIMYHGTFTRSRGLEQVIKAMDMISGDCPDVVLALVGSGPHEKRLRNLVRECKLEKTVLFHGKVPYTDIPSLLSRCTVGILPFPDIVWWHVSSPLKLLEYLAMEKPVILTEITAHTKVIGKCPCGLYIRSNTPSDIAEGLKKAVMLGEKLEWYGKHGRNLVKKRYSWSAQATKLETFLYSLYHE